MSRFALICFLIGMAILLFGPNHGLLSGLWR